MANGNGQPDFQGYFQKAYSLGLTPQQAIQQLEGVSQTAQAQAANWLRQQQLGGQGASPIAQAARYPLLAGSQALSGFENTLALPERGLDWIGRELGGGRFFNQPEQTAAPLTNALGATNNLALTPGYGPNPRTEQVLAAGARGVGGALPLLPLGPSVAGTIVPGAVGGVTGELAHQAFPQSSWIPAVAGIGAGILTGGLGQAFRREPTEVLPEAPGFQDAINKVTGDLGQSGTTMRQAGQQIKSELEDRSILSGFGKGPGVPFSEGDMKSYLKLPPYKLATRLAGDPDNLLQLRDEMPDQADALAAGVLNDRGLSGWKGMNKSPEGLNAFLPSGEHRQLLEASAESPTGDVEPSGAVADRASHALIAGGVGSILGAGLTHMGLLPGGEFMGGEIGALGGYMGKQVVDALANHTARSILAPWLMHSAGVGAASGAVGGMPTAPVLPVQ